MKSLNIQDTKSVELSHLFFAYLLPLLLPLSDLLRLSELKVWM